MTLIGKGLAASMVVSLALCAGCQVGGRGDPTSLILTDEEMNSPATLNVGDRAPPVVASEWLRGAPATIPEQGRVCVIDFWAGWCTPCKAAMPRLAALQAKHPELVVVGMTALDDRNARWRVDRGLRELEGVEIRLALDGGPNGDSTTAAYMNAAREMGIPRTFVIDKQGRLAWIGHPAEAEPVVAAVLAGSWDIAASARERERVAQAQTRARELTDAWRTAREAGDDVAQLKLLNELCDIDPEINGYAPSFYPTQHRIGLLHQSGDVEGARRAYSAAVAHPAFADDPWALAEFGSALKLTWTEQTDPRAQRAEELIAARRAAVPADSWDAYMKASLSDWDGAAYDVLARYWYARGQRDRAIRLMQSSIELTDPIYEYQRNDRIRLKKAWDAEAAAAPH